VRQDNHAKPNFEFGYMSREEKLKVLLGKIAALAFLGLGLTNLVLGQPVLHIALMDAASVLSGCYVYMNLFKIKTTLRDLFEPPYEFEGYVLAYGAGLLLMASIYFQIADFNA
jgi:hypothetical protein